LSEPEIVAAKWHVGMGVGSGAGQFQSPLPSRGGCTPEPGEQRDPKAAEELLPLVYEELRKLAAQKMAAEAPGQTLQPTALVHEAWLRLGEKTGAKFANQAHFFAAAAEAMRRILVENARRKQRLKHGGGQRRVDLDMLDVAITSDDDHLLAVDGALDKLAAQDAPAADLIKLRFFAGLPNAEAARLLGVPERSAKRTWAYARAWLYEELKRTL
jgi:RNA polymerase sigma factor (TIGR02999 family)